MTKPGDPEKGKAAEAEQAEQAAEESTEAVAQETAAEEAHAQAGAGPDDAADSGAETQAAAPKPRKRAPKKAEGTAAEKTGEGKEAAEAALAGAEAEKEPKPARRRRGAAEEAPAPARARRGNGRPAEGAVVRAHAKYVRTSARKARLVCDHLRGKSVPEARAILAHTPRAVARDWSKLLESAVANAEHNHELVGDDLRILSATADEGPTIKRFRPRAMGRATKIMKRTAHLSIALTPKES